MAGLALCALMLAMSAARAPGIWPVTTAAGLQAALVLARPGDTVKVAPGTYRGPFVVPVAGLALVGQGRPILDGQGEGSVVRVTAPGVSITGFRLTHGGMSRDGDDAGILVADAPGCVARGNVFDGVYHGIYLRKSPGCTLTGNRLLGAAPPAAKGEWGDGLHAWASARTRLEANEVSGFRDGLYLEFAPDSRLLGNDVHHNRRYGLHFMFMDGSDYRLNRFRSNLVGSVLMFSRRITIEDNDFIGNRGPLGDGVMFKENYDSVLRGNRILDNTLGLFMDGSNRNVVEHNLVAGNGWGLLLYSSSIDNRLVSNDFIANGYDVAVDMPTSRNTLEANYWSHYRGYDLDGDGRGDVPYAPVAMFSLLAMQYPDLYAFVGSPAVQALAYAQRLIPALSPSRLRDSRPRMWPVEVRHGRG